MESVSQFDETPLKSFKGLGAQLVRDKTYCVGFSTNPGAETFFKYCAGVTVFSLGAECLNMSLGNQTKEEVVEKLRHQLVTSMTYGKFLVINLDAASPGIVAEDHGENTWPSGKIFDYNQWTD